ncbi:MAG: SCO family protein [Vulcanimicrobiaceae bacterium]
MHSKTAAIGAALLLAGALAIPAAAREPQLIDQSGRTFTLTGLRGTPLVVTFVAARCKDACPLIDAETAAAVERARAQHVRVRFVTISLDPEHDSPATMRSLARTFGATEPRWIVATGRVEDVHAVMRAFDVFTQPGSRGVAEAHTTFVYLVDARGRVRKTLLASTDLPGQELAALSLIWPELTQ